MIIQPSTDQLKQMARVFRGGVARPDVDVTPDGKHKVAVRGPQVALDDRVVWDARQDVREGTFPTLQLPPAVTISDDGKRAVFQLPAGMVSPLGHEPVQLVQLERKRGWLGGEKISYRDGYELPFAPQAMDLSPDGNRLTVAAGTDLCEVAWGTNDWQPKASFKEPVLDVQYLPDGSMAVATRPENAPPKYFFLAEGSTGPAPVSLKQMDPQAFDDLQLHWLNWTGIKPSELNDFRSKNPWLFQADGSLTPFGLSPSPDGKQSLLFTMGEAGQGYHYDNATRTFTPLGQLDTRDIMKLNFIWDQVRQVAAGFDPRTSDLHVWNLATKETVVLPEIKDLKWDKGTGLIQFQPPGGAGLVEVPLQEAGKLKDQDWWKPAHERYQTRLRAAALGSAPPEPAAPPSGVKVDEAGVTIGGVTLRRRAKPAPGQG